MSMAVEVFWLWLPGIFCNAHCSCSLGVWPYPLNWGTGHELWGFE
jgi:hypothetical protein